MKTLLQLLLIGIVIMCFSKCYTADKAQQQVNKADAKFPEIVAKLARDKYPCTDLLKPDTVVTYEDSLIFIECPDSNYAPGDYATVRTDTIHVAGESRTVRVPVKILVPSKVINNWFEDSAKIKLLMVEVARLNEANMELTNTVKKQDIKIANKNKENWIWRIIALVLIAWQAIKLWKRLTTIKIT